ncbi:inorganic diphosphatase [Cyanobium sp. Morenito 9A2]|nr:inorganic diphosphatase [Cyanobium sp. Morenito 9A2]MCP9849335.1 inorganic diphosphatase [Cyanobium sp. Morenito 9A2]
MDLERLAASPAPGLVNLVVEIPAGSRNKYEYIPAAGVMALDRVLHSSVRYPFDYGFVPNTLAEDGAPLDAMVIMEEPTFAGCLIAARPIGVLDMIDSGLPDGKLLCVPAADPRQDSIRSIRQIAPNQLEEVAEFFRIYKNLEGRTTTILGWQDADRVGALLERCIEAADQRLACGAIEAPSLNDDAAAGNPPHQGPGRSAPDH